MGRSYYNGTFIRWTASLDPIVSDVRLGMGVDIGAIRRFSSRRKYPTATVGIAELQ